MKLKVVRSDEAKEFPMLEAKMPGDVGLDVCVCLPKKIGWEDELFAYISEHGRDTLTDNARDEIKHGHIQLDPGSRILVPTGIRLEIPHGYWVAVEARSSTSKRSLIVPRGVIDEGYRGEIFAQVINVGKEPAIIRHGDRLIQLILHKNYTNDLEIEEINEDMLTVTERGDSGFGSTGTGMRG